MEHTTVKRSNNIHTYLYLVFIIKTEDRHEMLKLGVE